MEWKKDPGRSGQGEEGSALTRDVDWSMNRYTNGGKTVHKGDVNRHSGK